MQKVKVEPCLFLRILISLKQAGNKGFSVPKWMPSCYTVVFPCF